MIWKKRNYPKYGFIPGERTNDDVERDVDEKTNVHTR